MIEGLAKDATISAGDKTILSERLREMGASRR
jgi:hypothetical protein